MKIENSEEIRHDNDNDNEDDDHEIVLVNIPTKESSKKIIFDRTTRKTKEI